MTELLDTLVLGNLVRESQEDGTTLSIHYYSGEGPGVGLTWSSLLDLTTTIEGQFEVCSRSVKCNNVSLVHERLALMDTLILGSLLIGSQKECVTLSMHRHGGEGPRVGLTWSSLLDLLTR